MPTESPASLLHRAAALMRQRAEAAKELTGDGNGDWFPWGVVQRTEYRKHPEPIQVPAGPFSDTGETVAQEGAYVPTGEAFVAYDLWAHDDEEDWHEAAFAAGPMPEPLAGYMAGMHPGVALAVAAWLEEQAGQAAQWAIMESDRSYPLWLDGLACPLAVARAFLDDTEGSDRG